MKVSIIIPTYNEANNIVTLIQHLIKNGKNLITDIIISDGGSNDNTVEFARLAGATVITSPVAGRAAQMNYGSCVAKGDIFYFVHADSLPPENFVIDIIKAIDDGYDMGRFRTKFNTGKAILKLNAWFTRFDLFICMGGDQTLFIKKSLFTQCKGFKEDLKIMEDYEFCERARMFGKYKIIKDDVLISDRKYDTNSWLTVQLANFKIISLYRKGVSQNDILFAYKKMLNYRQNAF